MRLTERLFEKLSLAIDLYPCEQLRLDPVPSMPHPCSHDWFQSATHVVLSVFAKNIDPEHSSVKVNEDSVSRHAVSGDLCAAVVWGQLFWQLCCFPQYH